MVDAAMTQMVSAYSLAKRLADRGDDPTVLAALVALVAVSPPQIAAECLAVLAKKLDTQ